MMNATESKLVVHKTMSDSCLEIVEDDEWLTQIVATNAEKETLHITGSNEMWRSILICGVNIFCV